MKLRVLIIGIMVLFLSALPATVLAGITGKIVGKVFDAQTKEPLPGANVIIKGTTFGAATDINGNYVILNVPPGTYTVSAGFIGYRTVSVQDVIVSVDLTTSRDFALPPEAVAMEEMVIVAERPLVNKNSTNETHIMTAEDIENLPLRNYAAAVATNTGVVMARNNMYVRGGRRDEVAFYVDGVYSNDLRTGQRVGEVPINSLEQINYQAGGFSAEYGFANSGVVIASSKVGGNSLKIFGEAITDEFLSETQKYLGTYSYGYNVYNLSMSGPLFGNKVRFFGSAEKTFRRDRDPSSGVHPELKGKYTLEEINYTRSYLEDSLKLDPAEWILPIEEKEGPLPNNALDRWALNGNLLFDFNPVRIKIGGNATIDTWNSYLHSYSLVNRQHFPRNKAFNYSVYGKITHTLGSRTFYEATGYYTSHGSERGDPYFWRNVVDYFDKSDFNNNGLFTPYLPQDGIVPGSKIRLGSGVFTPRRPYTTYSLNRANVLGLKFDLTHQLGTVHEFKTGFEYRYNTLRRYDVGRTYQLAGIFANDPNYDPRLAYRAAYTENYGYPVFFPNNVVDPSNTLDQGLDGAKHPVIAAFYLQDKIELSDLVLNLGIRADYMDARDKKPIDPYRIKLKEGKMDPAGLVDTEGNLSISPRIGLSFPVTDRTVFHAQWGKFVQQPELQYLYTGWDFFAGQLSQGNQVTVGNPDLKPVNTVSYEIGIGQQLGMNASLSITAYYKEISNLIVLKNRVNADPFVYPQYQNGDYGAVKGVSLNFRLRRTERVAGNVNYTLQYARGTGSTSDSDFYITWIGNEYYPTFLAPLDYDQRHTISVNVDFRFKPNDGPQLMGHYPFGNMGLNVLAQLGSGFPYTPKRVGDTVFGARFLTAFPVGATNSAYTNWSHSISLRLNKTVNLGNVQFDAYVWVLNVLGSKLPFNRKNNQNDFTSGIYEATGRPDDNGWLSTPEGQKWVEDHHGERAEALYRARVNNPYNWEAPRQIRLGLRFNINP